jgi:perosamine synthetase
MNTLPAVEIFTIESTCTLIDALTAIDRGGIGICFIANDSKIVGILTDGDVRRALIGGANTESAVSEFMKKDFIKLPPHSAILEIQEKLNLVKYIPIVDADGVLIDYVCAERYHHIPLSLPSLDGNELEYLTDCIQTGWISSQGKYVTKFEDGFGVFIGNPKTLAVSNGTVALHLALLTLDIGPGDEVIIPNVTFAAVINAVLYVGAIPVLVDINEVTFTIEASSIESVITPKTKAVIAVHLYGYPADMVAIAQVAKKYQLKIIEDCAEAIGTRINGKHVGNFSDVATFSFFGNKTMTTGEGGMVAFKDLHLLERAKILRDHGMSPIKKYWHEYIGYNYRLTNLQAAVGLAQVERVKTFIDSKRMIAHNYQSIFKSCDGLQLPIEADGVVNSYWLYTVLLKNTDETTRDQIIKLMGICGVEARPIFYPLNQMPLYKKYGSNRAFPASNSVSNQGISLPSYIGMSQAEIERVGKTLLELI